MGWGTDEHEGYADEKRADGSWSGSAHRGTDPDAVAYQAVCSCGWRSQREHPVPTRPVIVLRDERGLPYGPAYDVWIEALENAANACHEDWNAEHFEPMLGYEPHQHLILASDDGGQRHYLSGRPVHAGSQLELLSADGQWLAIRYEWSFDHARPPTGYLELGAPEGATRQDVVPLISFELPPRAILRWPE